MYCMYVVTQHDGKERSQRMHSAQYDVNKERSQRIHFYQRAALCARWSRGPVSSGKLLEIEAFRGNYDTGTYAVPLRAYLFLINTYKYSTCQEMYLYVLIRTK